MSSDLLRIKRALAAITMIAVLMLLVACGTASTESVASGNTPTVEPTEPPLINTPGPVSNLAPDFTLPSVQGEEYTLSQFRDDKPVAVVFYRAYW